MNYPETLQYLMEHLPMYQRIGAAAYKKDLTNTIELLELAGNPHQAYPVIHVAGTNGKGSVSHILAAILQTAGFKTGLYISPHYKDFRERIKINGLYIREDAVVEFVDQYKPDFERIQPSFFEITVAMAFDYFAKEEVEIAVIETGLGGRLDSTNVVEPELSIITNIGYDHMNMLGNTLAEIAFEKAGIIKQDGRVVIGETQAESAPVFKKAAKEKHALITFADVHYNVNIVSDTIGEMLLDIERDGKPWKTGIYTDLYGNYQRKNLVTVLCAVHQLNKTGYNLSFEIVKKALANVVPLTNFIGRCQVLGREPLIIADSGHNEDGIREIVAQIETLRFNHLHFVIGTVNDKDLGKILPLLPANATYYFCRPDIPRGLDVEILKQTAATYNLKGHSYPTVHMAFQAAKSAAQPSDLVFIGGSIFVVGEIL